ncbi:hypothetical protein CKO25_04325 [Thiocapsa imhoffii]|uniref:Helix-turn-helix domain-containing protein n=1 Tax=Thiocapsa imhoffii TaxID=382777 RepID=A0A9X0WGJ6_9GAMM|nr:hypothetical protein [Thiocapsa imhoffii]
MSRLLHSKSCQIRLTPLRAGVYKQSQVVQPDRGNDLEDRWRSVDEIAEYLGVSKDTVYAWVTGKGMPGHKVGRFWKFKRQDVDEWVRSGGAVDADAGKQDE